jgi:hypothetical protein
MQRLGATIRIAALGISLVVGCKPGSTSGGATGNANAASASSGGPDTPAVGSGAVASGGPSAMDVCREFERAGIATACARQDEPNPSVPPASSAGDRARFTIPSVVYRGMYATGLVARFPDDQMFGFMTRVAKADPKMSRYPIVESEKARVLVYLVSDGAIPDEIQAKARAVVQGL